VCVVALLSSSATVLCARGGHRSGRSYPNSSSSFLLWPLGVMHGSHLRPRVVPVPVVKRPPFTGPGSNGPVVHLTSPPFSSLVRETILPWLSPLSCRRTRLLPLPTSLHFARWSLWVIPSPFLLVLFVLPSGHQSGQLAGDPPFFSHRARFGKHLVLPTRSVFTRGCIVVGFRSFP